MNNDIKPTKIDKWKGRAAGAFYLSVSSSILVMTYPITTDAINELLGYPDNINKIGLTVLVSRYACTSLVASMFIAPKVAQYFSKRQPKLLNI